LTPAGSLRGAGLKEPRKKKIPFQAAYFVRGSF
jgi:hypothetical protein